LPVNVPRRAVLSAAVLMLVPMAACAPALDWREVRPQQAHVQALFPCRPSTQSRTVKLAAQSVTLHLHACSAGGQTWALAHADLGDPTLLTAALDELVASAASNLGAKADAGQPLQVPGATPHAGTRRVRIVGQLPDGQAVQEQVVVFTRGTVVYQATALGAVLPEDAAQTFLTSLRVLP